ncbi:translocation/assembly module TamB [Flavobacteriaceae bacterium]|nr:translocation/assembly module TamB [Flavobacteriaceae bacterium]
MFFALPVVQAKLGEKLSDFFYEKYEVSITVERVDLSYLGSVNLKNTLILDHHNDTIISLGELRSSIVNFSNLVRGKLEMQNVSLIDGQVNFKTYKGEEKSAFNQFIAQFKPKTPNPTASFIFQAENLNLKNLAFNLIDLNKKEDPVVYYHHISGLVNTLKVYPAKVEVDLHEVQLDDNFDMEYRNLTTRFQYTKDFMTFEKLSIETASSSLQGDLTFTYPCGGLSDFNNNVTMQARFEPSKISTTDLKQFYSGFASGNSFDFQGDFKGTLNDFSVKDLELKGQNRVIIVGDFEFKNAANRNADFSMKSQLDYSRLSSEDLQSVFEQSLIEKIPNQIEKLGEMEIQGDFDLEGDDIRTDLNAKTELGTIVATVLVYDFNPENPTNYKGDVELDSFAVGSFIDKTEVGYLSMKGNVEGTGITIEELNTNFVGEISLLEFNGYSYTNIDADGRFLNQRFDGNMSFDDPNLKMNFTGLADMSSSLYNFDFKAEVLYSDFVALKLNKADSVSSFQGIMDVDIVGNDFDNIIGAARFKELTYVNNQGDYSFENFDIMSSNQQGIKNLTINSNDIINGYLKGNFKFNDLPNLIKNVVGSQFTNFKDHEIEAGQHLEFRFDIYSKIIEVFFPRIKFSPNTFIAGEIDSRDSLLKFDYQAPELLIDEHYFKDIAFLVNSKKSDSITSLTIDRYRNRFYTLGSLNLNNKIENDTLYFKSKFNGGADKTEYYDLDFYLTFDQDSEIIFGFNKSSIDFKNKTWYINEKNDLTTNFIKVDVDKQDYYLNNIKLAHQEQRIEFKGQVIDSTYKNLVFEFDQVALEDISPNVDSLSLEGLVNGEFNFVEEQGYFTPTGELQIDSLKINNSNQGTLIAEMEAVDGSIDNYFVNLKMKRDAFKGFNADGYFDFSGSSPQIDLTAHLDEFKLDLFSPLGKDVLSQIRGTASGDFKLTGSLSNPEMLGSLYLRNAGMKFPYLNIDFDMGEEQEISLFDQSFLFNDVEITDTQHNTTGRLRGSISHYQFKNWNLDLVIDSDRLLALNTPETEEALFYGTAFIDGTANVHGFTDNLTIDVTAKTLAGTEFIIPLSDVKTAEQSSLIYFVDKQEENNTYRFEEVFELEQIKGVSLNFNLDVTKDAVAEIVIDKTSGSSLRGSGTGNLLLEIDTKGKFNMYGNFTIDQGTYNFAYAGIINKPFTANKGGTISWNGNPYLAELNLEAVHTVYANPKSLLENINTNRRIPVELVTKISGELYSTNQEFDIVIPNSSSVVSNELDFVLNNNDTNERMRQFFSLLLTKNFFNENSLSNAGTSVVTGTTTDIISGVLSDVLNSPDSKLQVDVGYSVADRTEVDNLNLDDQLDISLATQINDRILINGKVGVPVGGSDSDNSVIGEVKVEFLMNEEGTFRTTIFNRQNEIQYSEEEEGYTQGVGMSYQIDFDNLSEVWAKFKKKKKRLTQSGDVELQNSEEFNKLLFMIPSGI